MSIESWNVEQRIASFEGIYDMYVRANMLYESQIYSILSHKDEDGSLWDTKSKEDGKETLFTMVWKLSLKYTTSAS